MIGDKLGLTPKQWFCPICGTIIARKDKYCEECKEEARKKVRYMMSDFFDRFRAYDYESAGLISMVAKEIEEEEHEKAIRKFEESRKEQENV